MFKTVVVGTDGSDSATLAVREAVRLTDPEGGAVHIVSAYEPMRAKVVGAPAAAAAVWQPLPDTAVQGVIDRAMAIARMASRGAVPHTSTGDPGKAVLEVASEEAADLIVVGSRGMHGARRLMLGSVPNTVSHKARCSVLIVNTDG